MVILFYFSKEYLLDGMAREEEGEASGKEAIVGHFEGNDISQVGIQISINATRRIGVKTGGDCHVGLG